MYNDEKIIDDCVAGKMVKQFAKNISAVQYKKSRNSIQNLANIDSDFLHKILQFLYQNILSEIDFSRQLNAQKKIQFEKLIKNKILFFNQFFMLFSQKNAFFSEKNEKITLKTIFFQNFKILETLVLSKYFNENTSSHYLFCRLLKSIFESLDFLKNNIFR